MRRVLHIMLLVSGLPSLPFFSHLAPPYYAGLTVVADLFLGCTDFPQVGANTPGGQANRIELLETDGNGTVAAANMTNARNWTVSDVDVFGAYNATESP